MKQIPGSPFLAIGIFVTIFVQTGSVHVYTINNAVDGSSRCIVEDNNAEEGVSWELDKFHHTTSLWDDLLKLQICTKNGSCNKYPDKSITLTGWNSVYEWTQPILTCPEVTSIRWNNIHLQENANDTLQLEKNHSCRQFSILSKNHLTLEVIPNADDKVYKIFIDVKTNKTYDSVIGILNTDWKLSGTKLFHHSEKPILRHGQQWKTFSVRKVGRIISVQSGVKELAQHTGLTPDDQWKVTLRDTKGLWKIQYGMVYVAPGMTNPLQGSFTHRNEGQACIAIIYASKDKVTLYIKGNGKSLTKSLPVTKDGWKSEKVLLGYLPNGNYSITIEDAKIGSFRAVASIRTCQKEEYYVAEAKRGTPKRCYTLASNIGADTKIDINPNVNDPLKKAFQKAAKLGEKLVCPDGSCKSKVICDSTGVGCFCRQGFKGINCSEECQANTYGLYCKKTCGHCQKTCDVATGVCESCKDGYVLPYCTEKEDKIIIYISGAVGLLVILILTGIVVYKIKKSYLTSANEGFLLEAKKTNAGSEGLVSKDEFAEYVRNCLIDGIFASEYESLPRDQQNQWNVGVSTPNLKKNRYRQIVAYDFNRVVLEGDSGYINASYITDYLNRKAYIAAQGPKTDTIIDFWKMIWQEGVSTVVMMCELMEGEKVRCQMYWPDLHQKETYGDLIVVNKSERNFNNFTERTLSVKCPQGVRSVVHLQYFNWPRQGVPSELDSLTDMMEVIQAKTHIPILVHCSGGTGRTGTIILADQCLRKLAHFHAVNVFETFKKIRGERVNMVDTLDQYILVHQLIIAYLRL